MLALMLAVVLGIQDGKVHRSGDSLQEIPVGSFRVRGHVADVMRRFFENRIFSDYAKTKVWKEARDAFANPDDDTFRPPSGMWKGEFWGKLMLSACRVAEYAHDAELKRFLHEEALRLLAYQRKDGYLGTYVDERFVSPRPKAETDRMGLAWSSMNWNLWCRKYTLWGLLACWRLTGDRRILDAAGRAMDQQIRMLEEMGVRLCDTGTSTMRGLPPCSILKPLLWLHHDTHDGRYLEYAQEIYGYFSDGVSRTPQFRSLLDSGRRLWDWYPDENGRWGKAYEMMSCLDGMLELHRTTGREEILAVVRGMRERIRRDESNPCMSVGANDQFWGAVRMPNGVSEPCDVIHWMRLNHDLWMATGESEYVDALETTFYNAFLASVRPDGKWAARAIRSHGRHFPAPAQSGMRYQHCCVNNIPRGFMDVVQTIAATNHAGHVYLALYHDSDFSVGDTSISVSGNYPIRDSVKVLVRAKRETVLSLRVPRWCGRMTVNGTPVGEDDSAGGWTRISVPAGESVCSLGFHMSARIVPIPPERGGDFPDAKSRKTALHAWSRVSGEDDIVRAFRHSPALQVMRGPLLLAKSIKLGGPEGSVFESALKDGDGWKVVAVEQAAESVWGRWMLEFRNGQRAHSVDACDYSSAATWDGRSLEFNSFFE